MLAGPASLAGALEPGVHADPGSPAAKEYALPLAQAREMGGGRPIRGRSGALFGAGIEPSRRAPARHEGGAASASSNRRPSARPTSAAAGTNGRSSLPDAVMRAERTTAGGWSLAPPLAGGLGVLLLGGLGGAALRRGRRSLGAR